MPLNESVTEFQVDAMLCDSAVTAEGKLYVQGGGWTMLTVAEVPATLPRLGIGVVITVPYTATNQNHSSTIELLYEDGETVRIGGPDLADPAALPGQGQPVRADAKFNIGRPPLIQPGEAQSIPFAINIDGIQVDRPGGYVVTIAIDGTVLHRLHFRVINAAQQNLGVR